ncbi:hypothetical protein WJX81_004640 [Elliptochloris bilobata]|uniref:protein-serine/threonine phosphatase n=1 Tax=Elliptochloris bilobata TaxID=381761 RepID=A0AAW1R2S1_9CHLO
MKEGSSPVKRAIARRLTDLSALQRAAPEAADGFKLRERTFSTLSCADLPEERTVVLEGKGCVLSIRYAVWTRPGMDPGGFEKDNQDSWLADEFLGGSATALFGVFDGHGLDGRKAQRYREAVLAQFAECNRAILRSVAINCSLSGSTVVTALVQAGGRLLAANVGDSRAFLGRVDEAGKAAAVPLTWDHTPDVPAEAARIRAHQGRIEPFRVDGAPVGPLRVWAASSDTPGLSMTRAFGDAVAVSAGISSEPELQEVVLQPADKYLLLASDGIFEFMESAEIVQLVHEQAQQGLAPQDIAQALTAKAREQWIEAEGDVVDDCTAIVAFLD